MMKIRPFEIDDQTAVIELWRACALVVPWNDPAKDIARKMKVDADFYKSIGYDIEDAIGLGKRLEPDI